MNVSCGFNPVTEGLRFLIWEIEMTVFDFSINPPTHLPHRVCCEHKISCGESTINI